jgi:hypothetical protein
MVFYLPFYVTPTLIVPERAITANIPFVNVILIAADLATTVSVVDDINLAGTFVFAIMLFHPMFDLFRSIYTSCHHLQLYLDNLLVVPIDKWFRLMSKSSIA